MSCIDIIPPLFRHVLWRDDFEILVSVIRLEHDISFITNKRQNELNIMNILLITTHKINKSYLFYYNRNPKVSV